MPTLELHGYESVSAAALVERLRALIADLPFVDDVVFSVPDGGSRVLGSAGEEPFVRLYTRSRDRADALVPRVTQAADLEVVFLHAFERRQGDGATPTEPMADAAEPGPGFEDRLVEALEPVRQFAVAAVLYQLLDAGLLDALESPRTVEDLAHAHGLDTERVEALLEYLRVEGYLSEADGAFSLTAAGREIRRFGAWYTLLVGGYGRTLLELGAGAALDAPPVPRDLVRVGLGSCGISRYDAIPLTRSLMTLVPARREQQRILDLGCGNGLYLVELCRRYPDVAAVGVEPTSGTYREGLELVRAARLEDRIQLLNATASDVLLRTNGDVAAHDFDFVIFAFVLHELLGQKGEQGVVDLLARVRERNPDGHVIAIEVDAAVDDPDAMRHPLARAYYNPYFLLHPFTGQRLVRLPEWRSLFDEAGYEIVAEQTTDPAVDSTGLEVGFLLRARR